MTTKLFGRYFEGLKTTGSVISGKVKWKNNTCGLFINDANYIMDSNFVTYCLL